MAITVRREYITPKIAQSILDQNNNANYRSPRMYIVNQYAEKMRRGLWYENGEPIQFDENGQLVNGQHRLMAIVASGCAQYMIVVRGVKETAVYDLGLRRTWGDYTSAANNGAKLSDTVSGALTCVLGNFGINAKREKATYEAKFQYYQQHADEINKAELLCKRGACHSILYKGGCVAAVYAALRFGLLDAEPLQTFCLIVNTGFPEGSAKPEAALALRKTLQDTRVHGGAGLKLNFDYTYQAIVAYKKGLTSKRLYKESGNAHKIINQLQMLDQEQSTVAKNATVTGGEWG